MSEPHTGLAQPADRLHLLPRHREMLVALLREHLPGIVVWAYGNRVNGQSLDGSDLDLVLRGPDLQKIPTKHVADFEEALRESNIPFLVETRDWARLPESFHREIERGYVVLVEGTAGYAAGKQQEVTLGELVEIYDGPHATPKKTDAGPIFLGISNLVSGRLDLGKTEHLSEEDYKRWTQRVTPEPGDIVFSYETRLGEAAHIPTGLQCCLGRRMGLLRPKGGRIDARFLLYAFLGERFQEVLRSRTIHGSTVNRIPLTEMGSFPIEIPTDLSEQHSIAHILGTLDDKVELNRRMNETLESMTRALFKSWFVDFDPVRAKMEGRDTGLPESIAKLFLDRLTDSELGPIPEGWGTGTLDDIASLNPESWKANNAPEHIVYVDLTNAKWGRIEEVETFSWKTAPSRARRVLRPGDTIVGTVRPANGSYALIGSDGLTGSTGFAVLRPKSSNDCATVWCAATSRLNINRLAHLADGGAYPAVRPKAVARTPIVLADLPVRQAFSSITTPSIEGIENNRRESHTLATMRDTLLPKLVSGKLRIKEARTVP